MSEITPKSPKAKVSRPVRAQVAHHKAAIAAAIAAAKKAGASKVVIDESGSVSVSFGEAAEA